MADKLNTVNRVANNDDLHAIIDTNARTKVREGERTVRK